MNVYNFSIKNIEREDVSLEKYKGKVFFFTKSCLYYQHNVMEG